MKKQIDKDLIIKAGNDLVAILMKMALSENDSNSFLTDYMNNITSNDGIYKKQQDALKEFSKSSKEIEDSAQKILASTNENSKEIDSINTSFSDLNKHIDKVFEQRRELDKKMSEITKQIKHISDLLKDINEISEQTRMLSFNASIEAARAGEVGKGFRIIANEVKNLSNKTAAISTDIGKQVQELNRSIISTNEENSAHNAFLNEIKDISENSKQTLLKIRDNSNNNAASTEAMYRMVMQNQQNIQSTSEEVEASNVEQVAKIGEISTMNSYKTNDRLSFLIELKKLFEYMRTNEI